MTDARYGALGVLGANGGLSDFISTGVTDEQRAAIGDPPHGRGILGLLVSEARPLRLRNIADHPSSVGFPPNHPPMRSFLGAPVSARGSVFGNIYLTDKQGAVEFDEGDEETLVVLATQAGVAIENVRLLEETESAQERLRELSVLEDRERIARELHDGVIQSLFAAGMSLQGAAAMTATPTSAGRIEGVVTDLDRTIGDLRNYIFGLRPGPLADRELDRALRDLAEDFQERTGIVTVVEVQPATAAAISAEAGDVLQIVREALSNVGRHSGAETCRLVLRQANGIATLEVDDDGAGFGSASVEGSGLPNLRARAERIGATLAIDSSGNGTTVRLEIPLLR
ncbi:MAG TPA: GAF domain-containing sensor histidine kinase [Actinomycetota bacterium]|nr:GAF domain-containing sensor histidine kinase [Actinomycetota bacterium]